MPKIYTIGYEGSDVDRLVSTLQAMQIDVLADVRELPLSRKKGLSKKALAERLKCVGIDYIHFKALGDPKAGRDAAKAGQYDIFEKVFLDHLATNEAKEALEELLLVASERRTCMLCFERSHKNCHRSYIADEAANEGFEVYCAFRMMAGTDFS